MDELAVFQDSKLDNEIGGAKFVLSEMNYMYFSLLSFITG